MLGVGNILFSKGKAKGEYLWVIVDVLIPLNLSLIIRKLLCKNTPRSSKLYKCVQLILLMLILSHLNYSHLVSRLHVLHKTLSLSEATLRLLLLMELNQLCLCFSWIDEWLQFKLMKNKIKNNFVGLQSNFHLGPLRLT